MLLSLWGWVGHLARCDDGRWSKAVSEWRPKTGKWSGGRLVARWTYYIVAIALDEAGTGAWILTQTKRSSYPSVSEVGLRMTMMIVTGI